MRVLTLAGTRPELIRLSALVPLLDDACDHTFVHTGQNDQPELRDIVFDDLALRSPDETLALPAAGLGARVGAILAGVESVIDRVRPHRLVILGDTDTGLAAYVAARRGIPVVHLEAGNRCHDPRVPEEVNRRVIDHVSTVLLPYTERSAQNLVREGIPRQRIIVIGNPIAEVLDRHGPAIEASDATTRLGLRAGGYVLVTVHRSETVDQPDRLRAVIDGITAVADELAVPVVFPVHPRTLDRLRAQGLVLDPNRFVTTAPLGFFDFVRLQRDARLVATDSGTVQEECTILRVRSIILRDVTERPETIECGSSILAGRTRAGICRAATIALSGGTDWPIPAGYTSTSVAATALRATLGHLDDDA